MRRSAAGRGSTSGWKAVTYLEEVVVTAYTEQRRADITGAVASINVESAARQTGASVLQKLDAVPGITVATSGSPGRRSTVRIRGISSFQNNDPLYVIDGVPVQDSYINWLNPADITSIQVLKDASAASIYGSRASNGVIVIETTKRGANGPPRMTFSARTGLSSADARLRRLPHHQLARLLQGRQGELRRTPAGRIPTNIYGDPNNPTVPAYIFAAAGTLTGDGRVRPSGRRRSEQVLVSELADHARQRGHELVEGGVRPGAGRGLQPERRRLG